MLEIDDIAEVVASAVRPLQERLAELEQRQAATPEKGGDGIGLADALIDSDGCLVLTMTDGRTKALGVVTGKDGAPGETFTLDDFDVVPLDERTIKLCFTKGEVMHSFELAFPVPVYRDVFKEGGEYGRGDLTTFGGSLWHCNSDGTAEKPGTGDDWTLVAKKGRDGKAAAK